ncbi:hypothetical protein L0Z36_05540 [Burkholderia multivorans]|uniref:hypothetical protein n=1 Tax=Burkholderia multivorans TaxID=87883 RepID=UPI0020196459|nr:hypothetical protein [Burkholderia multivorans]UQP01398.1 hypothetical protein L0Z36_05540 [Burkholderia multivorans]
MAIKLDTITPQGFTAQGAYCRIEEVHVTKTSVSFALRRYKDTGAQLFFSEVNYTAPYALTGVNPIQQGYLYLKTLEDFKGSTDVFEAGQPQQ